MIENLYLNLMKYILKIFKKVILKLVMCTRLINTIKDIDDNVNKRSS